MQYIKYKSFVTHVLNTVKNTKTVVNTCKSENCESELTYWCTVKESQNNSCHTSTVLKKLNKSSNNQLLE